MKTVGIFQGKQKKHNIQVLTLLFDSGPLSAWQIARKIRNTGLKSLHATPCETLRVLAKKGYVRRAGKFWNLRFKGFVAVLLMLRKPRSWSEKWNELLTSYVMKLEERAGEISPGVRIPDFKVFMETIGLHLDGFDAWVGLSERVKTLVETGVINLDAIKDETLFSILIIDSATVEQLQTLLDSVAQRTFDELCV